MYQFLLMIIKLLDEVPSKEYCIPFFKKDKVNTILELEKIFNDPRNKDKLYYFLPDDTPFRLFPRCLLFTVSLKMSQLTNRY